MSGIDTAIEKGLGIWAKLGIISSLLIVIIVGGGYAFKVGAEQYACLTENFRGDIKEQRAIHQAEVEKIRVAAIEIQIETLKSAGEIAQAVLKMNSTQEQIARAVEQLSRSVDRLAK